ncbi:MAG: hypothetical protein M1837_004945 [Sclerophora amabilis]|nr:MAG: hypothetical protein M1837_004945 [Sclerophora amabilis]
MPRPAMPPTPGSSTELQGKVGPGLESLITFSLPPPAMLSKSNSSSSKVSDSSTYHPLSPTSPAVSQKAKRRRSSASQPTVVKEDFDIPPPPTRTRRIIQMKPGQKDQKTNEPPPAAPKEASKISNLSGAAGKKKSSSQSGTGGRKNARRTAHSVIERRRRSKMNEEFGILRDMIPACKDQDMHKLAILQGSIDYLRYLEKCVSNLQEKTRASPNPYQEPKTASVASSTTTSNQYPRIAVIGHDEHDPHPPDHLTPPDIEFTPPHRQPQVSPSLHCIRQPSSVVRPVSESGSISPTLTAPDLSTTSLSTSTSPNLLVQSRRGINSSSSKQNNKNADYEATEALMMLTTDRRGSGGGAARVRCGMSVKDLLDTER